MDVSPVVVGTDFSPDSKEALRQARAWAERIDAPLLVAHVASDDPSAIQAASDLSHLLRDPEHEVGEARESDSSVVVHGNASHELVEVARSRGAQLLVVGASGKGALERFVFGTTAEHCVRHAPCPVLVARAAHPEGPVLAATDFSDAAAPAVSLAAEEARRRGVSLVILTSVWEAPSPLSAIAPAVISGPEPTPDELDSREAAATEILETLAEREGGAGVPKVRRERPADAIVLEAREIGASLVVLGTHGRRGVARVALGSVAESVARRCESSVLCVRLAT